MKKIQSKMMVLECSQHYTSIFHRFIRRSRAANSAVHGRIWLNFELIHTLIVVLINYKNEEDRSRADSTVRGRIWPNFELIRTLIVVLITCKNEDGPVKNEGSKVLTHFLHYKCMGIFPDTQGQRTPQSLIRFGRISNSSEILLLSLLTAKMKKIRSKMMVLEC